MSLVARRVVAASSPSSSRRYPSPPLSLPVSSPVDSVIPPRLYPHRQPVRAPCRSSPAVWSSRRRRCRPQKTIFSKYYESEFTCHVFHSKSTTLFTLPFTALVAASLWVTMHAKLLRIL